MVDHGQGSRSGARDNGLRCASYVAVGDLDPRVADALLETLRTEGIAAYVTPTPAARGGYLDSHVPPTITDRVFADSDHSARALELVSTADAHREIDFDSAWKDVLRSLTATTEAGASPPWPASEDIGPVTRSVPVEAPPTNALSLPAEAPSSADDTTGPNADSALEEHFIPPPPPPLPRLRRLTVIALLSIVAGIVVLATGLDGGSLFWLGVLAILGGGATLVWQVKEGPPTDSGWDDGAVV